MSLSLISLDKNTYLMLQDKKIKIQLNYNRTKRLTNVKN